MTTPTPKELEPIGLRKRSIVRFLWATVFALHVLNVPAVWFRYSPDISYLTKLYTTFFGVSNEGRIPTWYSACTLMICSILLAIISTDSIQKQRHYSLHWIALAVIFALMSLDEAASIHEMTTQPLQSLLKTSGPLLFAWVIPGLVFVVVLGLAYMRFLRDLSPRSRNLFLFAGGVYIFGVLGMEMIGSAYVSSYGRDLSYGVIASVEELFEMSGITLFIYALLDYLETEAPTISFRTRR